MQNMNSTIHVKHFYRWKRHWARIDSFSISSRKALQKSKLKDNVHMAHVAAPHPVDDNTVDSEEAAEQGTLCMYASCSVAI